jgi:D-alanyl-D-alanine dipeptidase
MLKIITEDSHDVIIDLAYASDNNITGKTIYKNNICKLHAEAELALKKAVSIAKLSDLKIKIFDGFRPIYAQEKLWQFFPDSLYVRPPSIGSNHTRGIALDITLVDKYGFKLSMGTNFDEMSSSSHHFTKEINSIAQKNRLLLLGIMLSSGFDRIDSEWWHYELPNATKYPLYC